MTLQARPVVLAVMHPKGGVGRSTTAWHVAAELAVRGRRVAIEDLDQARHLSAVLAHHGTGSELVTIGEPLPDTDIVILDTAPEADRPRAIAYLKHAEWVLVPVKGPEQASVQVPRTSIYVDTSLRA